MKKENSHQRSSTSTSNISDESIMKVSKEVAIKFIEMGRITPATFDETFKRIHSTIKDTVEKG